MLGIRSELLFSLILLPSSLFCSTFNTKKDEVANGIMIIQANMDKIFPSVDAEPPLYVIVSRIKTPAITVALI